MPRVLERSLRTLIYTLHKQGKDIATIRLALAHCSPQPTRVTIKRVIAEEEAAENAGVVVVKNRRGPKQSTLEKVEKVKKLLVDDAGKARTNYQIARLMNDHPTASKHCMQLIQEQLASGDSLRQVTGVRNKNAGVGGRGRRPELDAQALERAVSPSTQA